jgi:hypothetical protein
MFEYRPRTSRFVELLGAYSNPDILDRLFDISGAGGSGRCRRGRRTWVGLRDCSPRAIRLSVRVVGAAVILGGGIRALTLG